MSESDENGGGCARKCGCLERIRKFPFCSCCKCFLQQLGDYMFSSTTLLVCSVLAILSWWRFGLSISLNTSAHCVALIFCAGLSRIVERGKIPVRKHEKMREQRRQREVDQPPREGADGPQQPSPDVPNVDQELDAAPVSEDSPLLVHHVEVYNPKESSSLVEAASSSSDKPLNQAASSDSGSNLSPSSTGPSTHSTSTTPLE